PTEPKWLQESRQGKSGAAAVDGCSGGYLVGEGQQGGKGERAALFQRSGSHGMGLEGHCYQTNQWLKL
ncbi:unnamed protein product, partial [Closterium sp. NIES-53]